MLPFDKTFRKTDTNVLDKCLNLCLNDMECVTFAFGISARGNGTCQLSSQVIDSTGASPVGTIFDPDFDLYARKTSNCLVDPGPNRGPSQVPRPGGFEQMPGNGAANTNLPPSRPTQSTYSPSDGGPTSSVFSPASTSGTYSTDGGDGTTTGDFATTPIGSSNYPEPASNNQPSSQSPDDFYNNKNNYPSTYPSSNGNHPTGNQPEAFPPTRPTRPIITNHKPSSSDKDPPPTHTNNKIEQTKPVYPFPIGPDPLPGYFPYTQSNFNYNPHNFVYTDDKDSHFPGIYSHNAPSSSMHDRFYHGAPPSSSNVGHYGSGGLYASGRYPESGQHYGFNGYNDNRKNGYEVIDNTPDVPITKLRICVVTILLGFNLAKATFNLGNSIVIIEDTQACFRRVLAGKRIASHWVRRTLICERLEDCQRECGDEKRFSCEGFNYRLDPSGRGQGECELIEVPLSRMDLYSSPHNRDANLISHPDYDYYERDRSSAKCRASPCIDCGANPGYMKPTTYRPPSNYKPSYGNEKDRYRPDSTAVDRYRPQNNFYESRPDSWDRYGGSNYFAGGGEVHYNRPSQPEPRPPVNYPDSRPPQHYPDSRPPPSYGFSIDRYGTEEGGGSDYYKPPPQRPSNSGGYIETGGYGYRPQKPYQERPLPPSRPSPDSGYGHRPPQAVVPIPQKPGDYDRPDPPYRPHSKPDPPPQQSGYGGHPHDSLPPQSPPPRPGLGYIDRQPHPPGFHHKPPPDYHPTNFHQKPSSNFIPYMIGQDNVWGTYGGVYGSTSGSISYRPQMDYWGIRNDIKRKDGPHQFNYFELGPVEENSVHHRYGGHMIGGGYEERPYQGGSSGNRGSYQGGSSGNRGSYQGGSSGNWDQMWTRRPNNEECSVKTSEGFRLHKGVVRNAYSVPDIRECEKMCYSEDKFRCSVFSFRYSDPSNNNCLLCDRSYSLLDSYADIIPDKEYDIYAMSDDVKVCKKEPRNRAEYGGSHSNDQCFIQAIETRRLYESIVRDSLTVRSIGECEIECAKAKTFTCRSFAFRYGSKVSGTIIDNCQLSDWPVRDMNKDRHLIHDKGFDVFERASYGKGCEIQNFEHEHDPKNPKLCYLGYGSAAKLVSSAIKKVISVPSEIECKNECIKYRETSPFKCLSFSFGSQASSFNCEMSDLDQSELKLDVHYTHTPNRDYWLFAWNPFDHTCRDKITSISGNRVNYDRRMDIFRDTGGHVTVSGKACRYGTRCEKNHIAGFYSCELEGGEVGSWDFCCRDDHQCGFSRDFDYPWCYVGVEKEQWRSCSVSYIPVPMLQGSFSTNRFSSTKYPDNKNDIFQSPPRPGGLQGRSPAKSKFETRLLPIQYLYHEGPPNATQINNNIIDCNRERC
ncbi:CLUMA_CG017132, isoform A [Clunio marinus]|uniref:CLUMA_CG017132, isoform A n=1 Tax=Clunio marinus TaxID=568069 RepID=A0A1J1IXY3_9DIPT|nr:CLUMA_CG017132, isoform A [Clunio marinus]